MAIRPAAVAGSFYPSRGSDLRRDVERMLATVPDTQLDLVPRMVIVPHAGYVYSGPVAASGYRALAQARSDGGRVVMMGPSHFEWFDGLATSGATGLATPLGVVETDDALTRRAESHPGVTPRPAAHRSEHSLEVQLPFLQVALGHVEVVAMLTGNTDPEPAAAVLHDLLDDQEVMAVISSDLSHYLDYETARHRDTGTARSITELQPERLAPGDACGLTPIQVALFVGRRRGWSCRLLDLRNSGDTAGPRDRVVGYGSFAIGPPR